jgi:beta-mannanase
LFFCDLLTKQRTGCFTFEDYYPGPTLVDIVGLSFYNRGKAIYDRQWLSAKHILTHPRWNTLARALSFGKPLIFDEVGTSAVWYRS